MSRGDRSSCHRRGEAITTAIVWLLLGALVNIAVAWGFAARRAALNVEHNRLGYFVIWDRPWQMVEERRPGMIDLWWYDLHDQNPRTIPPETLVEAGNARHAQRQASGIGLASGRALETLAHVPAWGTFQRDPLPADVYNGGDIAFGWPCVCLWMSTTSDIIVNRTANERLHGGWLVRGAVESRGNDFIALPYRPLWPGLAINTLLYATILWTLFAAPFALRRRLRIQRGLCTKCAYPVGTSNVCTECGAPVAERRDVSHDTSLET